MPYQTKHGLDSTDTRVVSALSLLMHTRAHYTPQLSSYALLRNKNPFIPNYKNSRPLLDEVKITTPSDTETDMVSTALSLLPPLAELQVGITRTDEGQKRQAKIAFPSLESPHITALVSSMPHILGLIRQGSLTCLTYHDQSNKDFSDLAGFVQAFHVEIASRFPSLTSLSLYYRSDEYALEQHCESLRAVIEPLYDLSRLQEITYHGVFCLDNDEIEPRLATRWPEIRSIDISSLLGTSPTYGVLGVPAKHCPHLTRLSVPIKFLEKDEPLRDGGVFSHRLRTFSAPNARVHCYASVVHYLDRMFPFLI
ncbi:hypothetical protein DFS33DRAFT_1379480 [Desarmillaria ectypa]|nr:hypothetical protein DFS33DRAFT_1379480 [Desarmillaria ectypa]